MYASRTTQLFVGIFTVDRNRRAGLSLGAAGTSRYFSDAGLHALRQFRQYRGTQDRRPGRDCRGQGGQSRPVSRSKDNRAHVAMHIDNGVEVDSEAIASILTSGLIGDKYVRSRWARATILKNGGTIRQTQSAFVLENAIGSTLSTAAGRKAARREADRAAADRARPPRAAVAAARPAPAPPAVPAARPAAGDP